MNVSLGDDNNECCMFKGMYARRHKLGTNEQSNRIFFLWKNLEFIVHKSVIFFLVLCFLEYVFVFYKNCLHSVYVATNN